MIVQDISARCLGLNWRINLRVSGPVLKLRRGVFKMLRIKIWPVFIPDVEIR
jgi:hypothetical protein